MIDYLTSRKPILIFALVVMLVTCIPYLIGYQNQGAEWNFTGFVIGVEDGNSYISKMLSGANGDWLFRSKHSTVPQEGVIAYLPYIMLGKLASGPALHSQLIALYHGFRLVAGFFAILISYELVCYFIKDSKLRWWAISLISLGGGLGWVLVAISQKGFLGSLPLDFISPESFGFIGLFGFPHLAAARALFIWGLYLFFVKKNGVFAGLSWLLMGFFQPMIGIIAWAIIGSYTAVLFLFIRFQKFGWKEENWKELFKRSLKSISISAPIVIYTAWIFLNDPYFIAWNEQNSFLSPHPLHYLIAYGLVLPFALIGIVDLLKNKEQKGIFLAAWLLIAPILVYAPVVSQRRLAEGLWVCLVIGMMSFFDQKKVPRVLPYLWCLLFPTTLFLILGSILQVINPGLPLYRPHPEVRAYEFLSTEAAGGSGILASFEVGNNLPARVNFRSVIGHGPETIGLAEIQSLISEFFSEPGKQSDCVAFFDQLDADYLFWGPEEQRIWDMDPNTLDCVEEIYNENEYRLFKVK